VKPSVRLAHGGVQAHSEVIEDQQLSAEHSAPLSNWTPTPEPLTDRSRAFLSTSSLGLTLGAFYHRSTALSGTSGVSVGGGRGSGGRRSASPTPLN
jgi:hypothetical protein